MIKLIAGIIALIAVLSPKQPPKQEPPVYEAPAWEYSDWATYEGGQDGGDIFLG